MKKQKQNHKIKHLSVITNKSIAFFVCFLSLLFSFNTLGYNSFHHLFIFVLWIAMLIMSNQALNEKWFFWLLFWRVQHVELLCLEKSSHIYGSRLFLHSVFSSCSYILVCQCEVAMYFFFDYDTHTQTPGAYFGLLYSFGSFCVCVFVAETILIRIMCIFSLSSAWRIHRHFLPPVHLFNVHMRNKNNCFRIGYANYKQQ